MYALISLKDGGLFQVNIAGHIFSPLFPTMEEGLIFAEKYDIRCKVQLVRISG